MAELKTKPTEQSVYQFLDDTKDEMQHNDAYVILDLMKKITKKQPKMWRTSMIGFGSYHYKYASGHEGDSFLTGFSTRKQHIVIYVVSGLHLYQELLKKIGKY